MRQEEGRDQPGRILLADLLLKAAPRAEAPAPGIRCEQCGFTQNDFKKQGRFGCPACYDAFAAMLEPLLDGMHKGTKHAGKVPQAAVDRKSLYDRMTKLELELTDAIKAERYEEAARFRDEINQMKKATRPRRPPMPMNIASLIATPSELTDVSSSKTAIVLMTRIRLARNLAGRPFPGWARAPQRQEVLELCREALASAASMKRSLSVASSELTDLEKQILVERHLISRELSGSEQGGGVVINRDQTFSVMINEEDHLRIQVLRTGLQLKKAWNAIDSSTPPWRSGWTTPFRPPSAT